MKLAGLGFESREMTPTSTMRHFPVYFLPWPGLLLFCLLPSGTEGDSSDVCRQEAESDVIYVQNATASDDVEKSDVEETFVCLLHPSNELNCSWSFRTLDKDSRLSVHIRVCKDDVEIKSLEEESAERMASATLDVAGSEVTSVVLRVNASLHGQWTSYTSVYDLNDLDLLPPPPHVNASLADQGLLVSWGRPPSRTVEEPKCFEYQLDMGDQRALKTIEGLQSFEEPNADPARTYRVTVRARIRSNCDGCREWSGWSRAVVVERSLYLLSPMGVVLLTFGIHLTLAVLLLVHRQRVLKVLFPPIPRPPPKYKYFLEKGAAFNLFHPAVPANGEEEMAEVDGVEKSPPRTSWEDGDTDVRGKC